MVFGHEQLTSFFETAMNNGRLSHAYCFIGEQHIGKKFFAMHIAQTLLKTNKLSQHPDYVLIEQEINAKTGKTKKSIDVEQIKKLREFFSRFSAMGGYRVAIIDNAELLNQNASNALLKTLEELPAQCIIFFITSNEHALPATIKSRCQLLYATPLSLTHMRTFADSLSDSINNDMLVQAYGKPGVLYKWVHNSEEYEKYTHHVAQFSSLWGKKFYEKIAIMEPFFDSKDDHIAAREVLESILNIWITLLRQWYLDAEKSSVVKPSATLTKENMLLLMHKIATAQQRLRQNVHPRLLIEDILLSIS